MDSSNSKSDIVLLATFFLEDRPFFQILSANFSTPLFSGTIIATDPTPLPNCKPTSFGLLTIGRRNSTGSRFFLSHSSEVAYHDIFHWAVLSFFGDSFRFQVDVQWNARTWVFVSRLHRGL
jgi:hypothetical protein